jgi:hypothetical protein
MASALSAQPGAAPLSRVQSGTNSFSDQGRLRFRLRFRFLDQGGYFEPFGYS